MKRRADGTIIFSDYPEFRPNLTPKEIFNAGVFGGTYFRPIYSSITHKNYEREWEEFPSDWFKELVIEKYISSSVCDKNINRYKVTSGTSLEYWEEKGWINKQDPYGWIQWYCRFYLGRRTDDDRRQIDRWLKIAGEDTGRWRKNLYNKRIKTGDRDVSPVINQLLLQWAYEL